MPARVESFLVPPEARRQRLDQFLAARLRELSRARIQQLIEDGRATLDGRAVRQPGRRLRGGEGVELEIVERPPLAAVPEDIPLRVLYEDDDLAVIDKPAGLVVHAGAGRARGTLVNALLHRFRKLSTAGGPLRPGIVHRLDKDTSGLLVVAKTDAAHRSLAAQFQRREVEKRYLVLVHGRPKRERGAIALPVARDPVRRTRMTARRRAGRSAETGYRVSQAVAGFALLEAALHTGRTHQIRVHFSALGHPVVGDALYGAPRTLRWDGRTRPAPSRNFLHAGRLGFRHPRTGAALEFVAPLPDELRELLRELGFDLARLG